ncbi:MAG TPA: PH domain-containing protein [Nocardioidaceae bacterium]|nr:PH domain-containing protein [Nocardioidaceae bacterium]
MSSAPEPPVRHPYRRLSPLTPLVRSAILLVAVFASTWDDLLRGRLGPLAWVFLVILVAGGAYGFTSWLRTKYWIESDELRVDTGVVSRQSRRIRVDRIQGIDIVQPFVARLFGLAELRLDVAGGGPHEGSLAFLPLKHAQALRETLLSRRDAVREEQDSDGAGPPPVPAPTAAAEPTIAKLDLRMLLVSLLLAPETVLFVVAALVLGVVFVVFGQVSGIAGVVPVVVGFALTQFRKLSAYYDFTVSASSRAGAPSALQVRRGLFELNAQTVNLARVQGVVVTEPFLWRRLGWSRLDVSIAGRMEHGDNGKPSASTVMPVAPHAVVLALARTLLTDAGGPDPRLVHLSSPPDRARWVAPLRWRYLAFGVGQDLLVGRDGVLTRRTHIVPHARVQSLRIHQRPLQRLLGLADLLVDSPPGPVKVRARHRDAQEARALLDLQATLVRRARAARDRSGGPTPVSSGQLRVVTTHQKSPSPPAAVSSAASAADESRPR